MVPGPAAEDWTAQAGAVSIVAPLGCLYLDGTPITRAECEAQYRRVCADNFARSRRLKEIERAETPDRFEYDELYQADKMGNLMARIWGGMAELLKLIEGGGEE